MLATWEAFQIKKQHIVKGTFLVTVLCFFVFAGCSKNQGNSPITVEQALDHLPDILEYIETKYCEDHIHDEKTSCSSIQILGSTSDTIYLYAFIAEYYIEGNEIRYTNAAYLPMALSVALRGDKLEIRDQMVPEDGKNYDNSMQKIFPQEIISLISQQTQSDQDQLRSDAEKRAQYKFDAIRSTESN